MVITMITEEICDLLEVSKDTLKAIIRRKTLEKRLLAKGYVLINKYKDGRNSVYELELLKGNTWQSVQARHNIKEKDKEKHTKYSIYRGESGMKQIRRDVIKKCEVEISYPTAQRYDRILEEEGVIGVDTEVYYIYNFKTGEFEEELTKEGYKYFWTANKKLKDELEGLRYKRDNYLITNSQYDILSDLAYREYSTMKDKIAIKFTTYKELENTKEMIRQMKESLK